MTGRDATKRQHPANAGFTLIELIVSLAVLGMAIAVYVSLYTGSLEVGESALNRELAMTLAEGQLNSIIAQPGAFSWNPPAPLTTDKFAVKIAGDDPRAGNPFDLPASMPADPQAFRRQENIFKKFRWKAFAQLSELDAPYARVTVTVHWQEGARDRVVALTSAVPRSRVEALAP